MTENEVQIAWTNFFKSKSNGNPDNLIKKQLVEHYYHLLKKVANRVHLRLTEVQPEELASMGVDGLYDAVSRYDTLYNTKFETYAMHRIKGSMLDAVRKSDWVPRLVRSRASWIDKKRQRLESEAGHRLSDSEIAEEIGMSYEDFQTINRGAQTPIVHSVEINQDENRSDRGGASALTIEDCRVSQPISSLLKKEFFNKLMGKNFTKQERMIIQLYYYEDRSMKEISEIVGLSESRVSQMHTMILKRLAKKIELNPVFFSDIYNTISDFKDDGIASMV